MPIMILLKPLPSSRHGLHTGIDEVRLKDVDIDSLGFPSNLLAELKLELGQELKGNNGESASAYVALEAPHKQRDMFRRVADNGIAGDSLATVRHVSDQEIVFELSEESDGTQRLLTSLSSVACFREQGFSL